MTRLGNPVPWLAALLAAYLVAPLLLLLANLPRATAAGPGLGAALATSLVTATISTAITALLGIPLAYAMARARGRGASLLWMLLALPVAIPSLMSGMLLLYLVGPYAPLGSVFGTSLTDSYAGIVLAQTFVSAPFLVITARAAFRALDPALDEVARTLGHGASARLLRVAVPAAWGGIRAGLLLAWLRAFGEFGATVIVAYHPYSLPVFTWVQFSSGGLDSTLPAIGVALGAALVVLVLSQVRFPRRRPHRVARRAAPPAAPRLAASPALSFHVSRQLRGFRVDVAHPAASRRIALLGPSGAGKTLTLRLLTGITAADSAEIRAGDTDLAALPPERRGIGYLPQSSALMPGRTLWEQATFGVRADADAAAWWIERLGLAGLEHRLPTELSGGQQRRVALARALACRPSLLLMDEPFSALDAPVRSRLQREMRLLQREAGLTTVLVTHDPEEAALLADDVVVIEHGRVLQGGPIAEVAAHPASPRVAELLGITNTHTGVVARPGWLAAGGLEIAAATGGLSAGTPVVWTVPPEEIVLHAAGGGGGHRGTVVDCVALGATVETTVDLSGLQLTVRGLHGARALAGDPCALEVRPETVSLWPQDAQAAGDGSGPASAGRTPGPRRGRAGRHGAAIIE